MKTVLALLERHPLSGEDEIPRPRHYAYGTAGFRYKADEMAGIVLRVGICCALLLVEQPTGAGGANSNDSNANNSVNMGVMLTASHNDETYNGVKVSNPDGSMIDAKQEAFLVQWVNERNLQKWASFLQSQSKDQELKTDQHQQQQHQQQQQLLHVGRDTRSHSPALAQLLVQGAVETIKLITGSGNYTGRSLLVKDHGILTTPMLHHIVLHSNTHLLPSLLHPSVPTRQGYLQHLAEAYCDLQQAVAKSSNDNSPMPLLQIDSACGVGYDAVKQLEEQIYKISKTHRLQPWNGPTDGPLNTSCGSEHVQKQLQPPTFYGTCKPTLQDYCCSLDGDADRIVFFSNNTALTLLDGDKIAVLWADFFKRQHPLPESLKLGVVQTAYANGASTNYLRNTLQIPVIITKTGVKHLHHAAVEHFDVGVYFEANGHGTVIFGPKFYEHCENHPIYQKIARLINPAVGDALSDLLLVDIVLQHNRWTLQDWDKSLYEDLPSRQLKVKVQDRTIVKCNDNETKCIAPVSLQPALDALMAPNPRYRCFVRASGTENVIRVYAEAPTRDEADRLASATARLVQEHCGGVEPLSAI